MGDAKPCTQCGTVHKKCAGHRRRQPGSTAKLKPCGATPKRGKRVCRIHGADTPAGIASPHFKTGERSQLLKHLPPAWKPHFKADNPDADRLTNELRVLDAAITDVYVRMSGNKTITAALKKELGDLYDRKARLVAVDSRRRKDEHEMVSKDQFAQFARAWLSAIAVHIEDRALKAKIQDEALRILAISQVPLVTEAAS